MRNKILGIGLLNLVLVAIAAMAFVRLQFRVDPESLLAGPVNDRMVAIADLFLIDLEASGMTVDQLLKLYGERYDAAVFLTNPSGGPMIGSPEVELPPEVTQRARQGGARPPRREDGKEGPPPPREPPPPPPHGEGGQWRPPLQQRERTFFTVTHTPTTQYWAAVRLPLRRKYAEGEGEDRIPGLLLLRSDTIFNSKLFFDWVPWLGFPFSVLVITALCWLPFIRGITSTIARMDRVTGQLAQGRFDVRAATNRNDELGHLGNQIDSMAARLEHFVRSQKRFLGDIAHELCAPIARIQFALGLLEQRIDAAHQKDVEVLRDEIQEMSGLVNELLSFSKAGLDVTAVALTPVNVADALHRAVTREGLGVEVRCPGAGLQAAAHEGYLVRAISNLIRNAGRYAGSAGPIEVSARRDGAFVEIVVADCGPGLPEAALEQVFEPFYRLDSSRNRDSGGTGLGLAIVKSCVEVCRGTVCCRNRKPNGLEVVIRLAAV